MQTSLASSSRRGARAGAGFALGTLNLVLLSPLFFYELRLGEGGPDRSFWFLLPASVLGLLTVHLNARRPFVTHLWMAPFYAITAVDLYLIATYGMRLGSSTLLVLVENAGGAGEYFAAHRGRVLGALALLVVVYGGGLLALRDVRRERSWPQAAAAALGFALVQALFLQRLGGDLRLYLNEDRGAPFGVFSQGYLALSLARDGARHDATARAFSFQATRADTPPEPETYVLVIGESARPDHFGLYGYARPTTPRLGAEANLVVFRDVVSQAAVTRDAVPFLLTRGSVLDPRRTREERGVVSVFRELGFATTWLSTQQRDFLTGPINRFASEADVTRFYEHRYDGALLPELAAACESPARGGKRFIVLHTLGSHYHYPSRHPPSFEKYPEGSLSSRDEIVNAYDDTVLYTDHVVAEAISVLAATRGLSALLYVADHGENLRDDGRELFGHMMSNGYDLPVPMLLWFSPEYARRYPDQVQHAQANAQKRLSTRHVFATLVGLASARFASDDAAHPVLSVLSENVSEPPRWVLGPTEPFDFDVRYRNHPPPQR